MSHKFALHLSVGALAAVPGAILSAVQAAAQNATADAAASCNASFHLTCTSTNLVASFSGTAAPLHGPGDQPLEFALGVVAMVGFVLLARTLHGRRAAAGRPMRED